MNLVKIKPEDKSEEQLEEQKSEISGDLSVNFLIWVRNQDYYYVRKRNRWFHSDGSLLTEQELFNKYLNI